MLGFTKDRQTSSVKDQILNILGFMGHTISVAAAQL